MSKSIAYFVPGNFRQSSEGPSRGGLDETGRRNYMKYNLDTKT